MALRDKPKGRGDGEWYSDLGGFSQTVIPAKGEAREPGSIPQPVLSLSMDPGSGAGVTIW